MLVIHLDQLQFFAYHGYYEEEKKMGGDFVISVELELLEPSSAIMALHESVNYVQVYDLVKMRMQQPTPLLETIVMELADSILARFSQVKKVSIRLDKPTPPIAAFRGKVGVSYSRSRTLPEACIVI